VTRAARLWPVPRRPIAFVDDLLSARRIPPTKDGARTLIRRDDLDAYLANSGNERRRRR
jgi:excisionase family DNA binding protein